ncbi:hypothetical protein BS17DRAFT_789604 [Gyrodon lividus]|nr:hypothetical protein BS17DRAFT_789604 [Gyrodon lividus]
MVNMIYLRVRVHDKNALWTRLSNFLPHHSKSQTAFPQSHIRDPKTPTMIDPFNQWIIVPDDQPALPPVDEEVNGLKDITSLSNSSDLYINEQYLGHNRGLLLDQDVFCPETQDPDAFEPIIESDLSPHFSPSQTLALPDAQSPMRHYYFSDLLLPPPALSPDSSPASAASSTPWLRTPENDMSLAEINNFTPEHTFYVIPEIGGDEPCPSMYFLDQCGHSLEDVPTQVQGVMQEDLACTPEPLRSSGVPLPPIHIAPPSPTSVKPSTSMARSAMPHQPLSTPVSVLCSPLSAPASPRIQTVPLRPNCRLTSLPHPTPPAWQYLSPPPMVHPAPSMSFQLQSASPQLRSSPLSPLTVLSRSPSLSPVPPSPIRLPSLSPSLSCASLSDIHHCNEGTAKGGPSTPYNIPSPVVEQSTVPSVKALGKRRRVDSLDDTPPPKISKRSKVNQVDEAEYRPSTSRPKRKNAASFSKPPSQPKSAPSRQGGSSGGGSYSKNSHGSTESPTNNTTYCKVCKISFTRPSDYARHLLTSRKHSKKLWPCRYCGRLLARADAQSRHINTIHPGLHDPKDPPVEGDGLIADVEEGAGEDN